MEEGEIGNLEEWSSAIIEGKMSRFDDIVGRLQSAISNVEKKERRSQGKAWRKYNSRSNVQKKDGRRVEDLGDEVTDKV